MSEITVEPITVWTSFATFVFGMLVGVLIVLREAKRARRRWREATRTWHEIELVAVEHRASLKNYRDTTRPDMAAAIRDGETEQLKRGGRPRSSSK